MKPCKHCFGIGVNGIDKDYSKCTKCNGSGIQNDEVLTVFIFALMLAVVCAVVVVMEVMK